jgi:O-antigen/teichoic acid export membrane protein
VACGLLLGVGYAVGSWVENLGAYFQAVERMQVWMQAQTLSGLVTGGTAVVAVLASRDVVWFAAAHGVGQMAALAWLFARAPGSVRGAWRAPWPLVARLLRSLLPFTVSVLALTAYAKVDMLLLERWKGLAEAGIYAAAYKFVDVAQALAIVVAVALYPRISRSGAANAEASASDRHDGGSGRIDPAAGRTAELVLLAGVPAAALLWLLREPVVALVFGPAYASSARVLAFLAPLLPILALNVLGTFVLAASRRMSVAAALYMGGVALDVLLNVLLVPTLGAEGAALARLLSEAALGVAMLLALRRLTRSAPSPRVTAAACVAAASAALLAWPALPPPGVAAAYLAISALVYVAIGVVSAREVALLKRAVSG